MPARVADGARRMARLPLRAPYPVDWVMGFLARRALPGLEWVEDGTYRRRVSPGANGMIEAHIDDGALHVRMPPNLRDRAGALARLKRIFDADADPTPIDTHLSVCERLGPVVALSPGIRVPGAWDGFELAVRAILGQQVSVERMTRLSQILVERYGDGGGFPQPETLARENPAGIGMPGARGAAIQMLAQRVAAGDLVIDDADPSALRAALRTIPGVGPWTAEYIALRAGRDPDAFPDSDWVVLKVLGTSAAGARRIAEAWRPWRAYALMYLWLGNTLAKRAAKRPQ